MFWVTLLWFSRLLLLYRECQWIRRIFQSDGVLPMSGTPSVSQPWPSVNQSQHQKLCRETFRPKKNLHATRNPKWRNPRSSLIWRVFSQTTEDLSERLSDLPINKLLENCYSVTDVCGYHPLSRSEPVHLWMSFKLFTDSLFSPHGSHVSSEF